MILTIDNILAMHGIGGAIGSAVPGDVRVGKTFSTASGLHTGTLADNGNGPTVTPSKSTQTLAAGIYDTAITIQPAPTASGSGTISSGVLTVSGLSFQPSMIVVEYNNGTYAGRMTYDAYSSSGGNNSVMVFTGSPPYVQSGGSWTVTATGFTCNANNANGSGSAPANWWAWL